MNTLLSFTGSIRWQDVADIIINSYILFRFYVIFRGTNAFRVLIGIALLWLFQRVAASLGLIVTSWAIQAITAVAAIIIIVVFRNEIRSVLQTKNLKSLLWGLPHQKVLTPIEVIGEGVFDLARKHIGALIVFPAKEDLKELVHSGILWDGVVSREMILSIFWHDNPVHDGAVVIKGDRVVEVGVILPLSRRKDLPSDYGTRHRAALGLAESSDALAIVVSEEKGKVLAAKDGLIRDVGDRDTFKKLLQEHTGVGSEPGRFYQNERFEIGLMALVSFLLVVSFWFGFFRGRETLITLKTPIDYFNRNPKVEILETSVNSVNLNLSGSGPLIKSIRPEQVMVRINLGEAVVGRNTFLLTRENISLPPGVTLKSVTPDRLDVLLDFPITKRLPVQVDWAGKLDPNLILVRASLEPEAIDVIGRNQILENVTTIYTDKIVLDKIKQSGTAEVSLSLSPASLKLAPGSKDKVTVRFEVAKRLF